MSMLEEYLKQTNNYSPFFLIGSNGVGKTYKLMNIHLIDTTKNMYISEEGELLNTTPKNRVKIDLINSKYIFESDETKRGNRDVKDNISRLVDIDSKFIELLDFCSKELLNISKIRKKSKGQEKLVNILEILTSIFLNPISVILFDEPENFLDDNYLRIISIVLQLLEKAQVKVVLATHNARLCELCDMEIDNMLLLDIKFENDKISYTETSLSNIELKNIYINVSREIQDIAKKNKYNEDAGIMKKLKIYDDNSLFESLLNHFLKSEDFYRVLFYKKILIVEGETEKVILKKIFKNISDNSHFYCPNGKAFLPFFTELLLYFNKDLKIVLDSDRKLDGVGNTTAVAITDYFESKYKSIIRVFEPDLEKHFHIDLEDFRIRKSFSNKNQFMIKQFASEEFFANKNNLKAFIDFIK